MTRGRWTLGILVYEMLIGYPPFEGPDPIALYKTIVKGEVPYPQKIGPQAADVIKGLLTHDQAERLGNLKGGADDVKKHAFFKKISWPSLLLKKIEAPYKPTISSALDASNFDHFDDPDAAFKNARNTFPKGTFSEFTKLTQSYSK